MIPLLLAGCLFLTERDLQTVSDADGDGFLAASVGGDDCDDTRADVHPGAGDAWYDGIDGDCDGASDFDQDGDGLDAAAYGGLDCDDTRRSIRADPTDWFPDCDGDGFGDPTPVNSCGLPRDAAALVCSGAGPTDWIAGSPDLQLDCDDTDPAARPYGPDQPYDGIDGDCDGANDWDADHDGWVRPEDAAFAGGTAPNVGDCDDTDATANPATLEIAYDGVDGDCDGGDDYDQDGDGYRPAPHNGTAPADCNDQDASIHPGVPEVWYDGVDDDCDGTDDDQDGDGAGRLDDCDDLDPTVFPGATEVWYDGADQDCDGANDYDRDGDGFVALGEAAHAGGTAPGVGDCDDGDPTARPGAAEVWYDGVDRDCSGGNDFDQDGDGVVASGYDAEAGGLATGDCDDLDASVRPGVPERWYDGVDGDCDGSNDYDRDGDGAVIGGLGVPGGTAVLAGDCDDDDPLVGPGATEVFYDGVDSDCAGDNDYDADGDGFVPDAWAAEAGGTAPFTGDCDDADAAFHPLAPEVWYDGLDQDCAGGNDYDRDGDGFVALAWAAEADGLGTGDCQDGDPAVRPDATEIWYDGLDQDCDGADDFDQDADGTALGQGDCDDTDPAFGPDAVDVPYDGIDHDCAGDNDYDADHDGAVALGFEAEIGGTAPRTGDCDDQAPGVHPLRDEVFYDGIDQDCSPANDDDADGDGVASTAVGGTDCNDLDPAVRPGVAEVWYDGVDQDCSGGSDFDQDGDGVHSALDPFVQGVPDACDTVPGPYQDASFVQIDAGDDPVAVLGALCPGGDVLDIQLASGTFVLTDEIVLDARNVSISGSSGTVLLGSGGHRLLHLTPSVESLYLADLEGVGGDTPGDGGCVWMENPTESTRLELYRTVFRECHADGSGGVFTAGGFADITVVESEFERNSARRGGVFHSADAYFDVQDSTFGGNTAECGGSIDTNGYSYVRFRDLRFVGDHATERGGSLNLGGAVQIDQWENLEFVGPRTDSRAAAFFIGPETGSGGFGTSVLYGTTVRGAQAPVTNGGAEAAVEIYDQRLDLYDLAILGGRATNGLLLYGYDSGGFGAGGGSYHVTGLVVDGLSAYHSVRTHGGELFLDHVRVAGQSRPPSSELAYVDPVLDSPCDRDDDGFELPGGTYGPHEVLDCVYTFPVEPYEAPQPCDPWFGCDIAQESCGAAIRLTGDAQTYVEAHFVTATANATPHQLVVIDPEQNGMGAVVLSELVLGSASAFYDRAGLLMGDYTDFGFSDIRNVHGVHGNAFRRIPSEDPTPIGSNSTLSADDPFLAPHPATDGHLDPAHPVASAGDPSVCSVWDPPECPMPGFWGGPAW